MKNLRFWKDITLGVAVFSLAACSTQKEEPLQPLDDVMMQAFYWDVPVDCQCRPTPQYRREIAKTILSWNEQPSLQKRCHCH